MAKRIHPHRITQGLSFKEEETKKQEEAIPIKLKCGCLLKMHKGHNIIAEACDRHKRASFVRPSPENRVF